MPLNKSCSIEAFRENVAKSIDEGRPNDQAVAIAMRTLEDACEKEDKPMPDVGEIVPVINMESPVSNIDCSRSTSVWGVFDLEK